MDNTIPLLIGIGALVIIILIVAGFYNKLVTLRNRFKNSFAQIDVQLKRRNDLIPNLVEVVKGYMKHEKEVLENVTKARNVAASAAEAAAADPANASAMNNLMGAEAALGSSMGRLLATFEAYPDLKANQNVMSLQEELTSTENRIAFSRQAFNDSVMFYNTKRETFPTVIFAGVLGFSAAALFEITDPAEREAPKVSLS